MRNYISAVFIVYLLIVLCSCSKETASGGTSSIDSTYFDPPLYRLKSYAIANVANSNYSFTYDSIGRLKTVHHASDLDQYKCFYHGKVLYKMINQNPFTSADTIQYYYEQGLLSRIAIVPGNSAMPEKLEFVYDNFKRITLINWFKSANSTWDVYRKLAFTYGLDNNISTYKNYFDNGTGLTLLDETSYTGYDNAINPKANFFIIGSLNEHFVYVPYIKLQINNAINETMIRGTNTFATQHQYSYSNSLPTIDNKTISITPATGVPSNFTGTESYEYY